MSNRNDVVELAQDRTEVPADHIPETGRHLERCPFPIPVGWFFVAFSDTLKPGEVRNIIQFDQEWVMYRGEGGTVGITDPYCPHLGAHMGHGGTVCGEHLRCPFHHWQYDAKGWCKEIPYAKVMPPITKKRPILHTLPTQERYGQIWAWYHPDGEAPAWELPHIPCMEDDGWVGEKRGSWEVSTCIQEIVENSVDIAHLKYLHGNPVVPPMEVRYEGHEQIFSIANGFITGHTWGAGGVGTVTFTREGVSATLFSYTQPITRELTRMNMTFRHQAYPKGSKEEKVALMLIDLMVHEAEGEAEAGFEKVDMIVWNNKKYRHKPLLCDGDGTILQFRKWFRQFYIAPPEVMAKF